MNSVFVDKLTAETKILGISLSKQQIEQFEIYYKLLTEWNKVMNLTAITEMDDVIEKHFVDSLSLVRVVKGLNENDWTVLDVGTGAGFPGIPLKIAFPRLQITLLDSLNKRIRFLEEVISCLGFQKIVAVHGRAEDFGKNPVYREQYDFCVSRAVANVSVLSEYCLPFVRLGGCFIPYKSGKIEDELSAGEHAISILGGTVEQIVRFSLGDVHADRSLIVIRKQRSTPKKYPRKAGTPIKEPIS